MKYILDANLLITLARGDRTTSLHVSFHRKSAVAVPQPVLVHVDAEVRRLARPGATKRWAMLLPVLPRLPWTDEITDVLMEFARMDIDAIAAAHARALDATVLTTRPELYAALADVRTEEVPFEGEPI